jgi:hypothetical protein
MLFRRKRDVAQNIGSRTEVRLLEQASSSVLNIDQVSNTSGTSGTPLMIQ